MLICHNNQTQTQGTISSTAYGPSFQTDRAYAVSAQCIVTAAAPTGASVQLQKSNDNVNWSNDGAPVSVTATGVFFVEKVGITSKYMRVAYVISGGSMSSSTVLCLICDMP